MDFLILHIFFIILLIIHLILTIFSCNIYYYIIDSVVIGIFLIKSFLSVSISMGTWLLIILFFYICIRGIFVLILFLSKYKMKKLIKINMNNFRDKILMIINIIINLILIFKYIYGIFSA